MEVAYGDALSNAVSAIEEPKIEGDSSVFTFEGWINANDSTNVLLTSEELLKEKPTKDTTYIAKFSGKTIEIGFDSYDGDISTTYEVPQLSAGIIPAAPVPVVKSGKVFANWLVTKSLDHTIAVGNTYTENEMFDLLVKDEITFKAVFTSADVSINFDLNGGEHISGDVAQTKKYGEAPDLVTCKKDGYVLDGWLNVSTGKIVKSSDISSDKATSNVLYIAQWKEDIKTVTFDANGGNSTKTVDVRKGGTIDVDNMVAPEKIDNLFLGWSSNKAFADSGWVDITGVQTIENDITYVASYSNESFDVIFQDQDGNVIESKKVLKNNTIGNVFKNEPIAPQQANSSFKGWKMNSDVKLYSWNDITTMSVNEKKVLTATYEINTYSLHFDANGGSNPPSSIKGNYNDKVLLADLKKPTPLKGFAFDGWFDAPVNGNEITEVIFKDDVTLYAQYKESNTTFTIEYYQRNLNSTGYTKVSEKECEGKTGTLPKLEKLSFKGFTYAASLNEYVGKDGVGTTPIEIMADGSLIVRMYYDRNSYKLTYEVPGHQIPADYDNEYEFGTNVTLAKPISKEGFGFDGWFCNGVTITDNTLVMPAEDIVVNGRLNANQYSVRYVIDETNGNSILDSTKYTIHDFVLLPTENPTQNGRTFLRWESDDITINNEMKGFEMPSKDVVIKAIWEKETYTLTFKSGKQRAVDVITADFLERVQLPEAPQSSNQTFVGWKANHAVYEAGAPYTVADGDVSFSALWETRPYEITYHLNSGLFAEVPATTFTSEEVITLTIPQRTNYIFEGWYLEEDYQTAIATIKGSELESDVNVYAKWKETDKPSDSCNQIPPVTPDTKQPQTNTGVGGAKQQQFLSANTSDTVVISPFIYALFGSSGLFTFAYWKRSRDNVEEVKNEKGFKKKCKSIKRVIHKCIQDIMKEMKC